MARLSKRSRAASHKRASHRNHKRAASHKRASRRNHKRASRRHGGSHALHGSPLSASLAGDWASQRSMGQGADYLKYHVGQHGGAFVGAPLSAIDGSVLPAHLQGSAHVAGSLAALQQVAHLKDQAGGKRAHRSKRSKRAHRSKRSKRDSKRSKRSKAAHSRRRRGGGLLHGAPISASPMLLQSAGELAAAGLSPEWRHSVEANAAHARQGL